MKDKLTEQQSREILKALDEAIEEGPWDESNFLRVIGKNLQSIRDKLANYLNDANSDNAMHASNLANRVALRSGQQEIFIGLYSTDGSNLASWERIIANLPTQIIARPIYANEQDVKEIIRTKEKKVNEAYVSIYVSQNDILSLPADKMPLDKLGKPLMTLKDKAINIKNINRFVHQSGTYKYEGGRLTKKNPQENE
ncbi:Dot/Icm secretion system protein IcmQ [Legionella londiniensis]|uniref:IcmQ n=1 Tax=Legionella londiniensis TaxID=45068 RepID=Q49J33_9GAMM|nr:Dot/Icm secretion system protein IcmQ [Legionella londiniensis]AAX56243.1 IcmQ [Legionella londiniensis]KTD21069.1 IcmQ protein [Legionella londiniensis]STX93645.1 IcmQ protein [Legionella londiniensis]